jgi:diguanylate cyclase (GGDEF)-like protein/PAS domain S-box-containing protein
MSERFGPNGSRQASATLERDAPARPRERPAADPCSRLGRTLADAPIAIWTRGADNRIDRVNAGFERLFGVRPEAGVHVLLHDLLPTESARRMDEHDRRAMALEAPEMEELELEIGGEHRVLAITRFALRKADGSVFGTCATALDVTAQHGDARLLRLRAKALDASSDSIIIVDVRLPDTPVVYVNDTFTRMTGYAPDEVLGRNPRLMHGGQGDAEARAAIRDAVREGRPARLLVNDRRKDGTPFWNSLAIYPVPDDLGRPAHYVGIQRDVTAQVAVDEAARRDRERLRLAQELARAGLVEWDVAAGTVSSSALGLSLLGFGPDRGVMGTGEFASRLHPDDAERFQAAIATCIAEHSDLDIEFRVVWRGGHVRWLSARGNVTLDAQGQPHKLLALISDISERRSAEEEIRRMALQDALTGLPNRAQALDRLERAIVAARRRGDRVGVLFLDLDHFKATNDALGHDAGDRLLREVADRLTRSVRAEDTVGRHAGDEFLIVLPSMPSADGIRVVAEKVSAALREPLVIDGTEVRISASIGIAVYPEDGTDGPMLVRNADAAMYDAKSRGRSRFAFFNTAIASRMQRRSLVRSDLRRALETERGLALHYQPIFDTVRRCVVGLEALVRWPQQDGSILDAEAFLPHIDDPALLADLGRWVTGQAGRHFQAWSKLGATVPRVSINVAPSQFRDHAFVENVLADLREHGLPPERLMLEVTEQSVIDDDTDAPGILSRLAAVGVHTAVDDFGVGFSSLARLKDLQVHSLKIDRAFVHAIEADRGNQAIVAAILSMSAGLGMEAVAEGVERPAELQFLTGHGCVQAQGFLLGRPMPAREVLGFLKGAPAGAPRH